MNVFLAQLLMHKVAIFVSGSGSLLQGFADSDLNIELVVADRDCLAKQVAKNLKLKVKDRKRLDDDFAEQLNKEGIDLICLAGFLRVVPAEFLDTFDGDVLNVHPSLLPKYGGKNYYGDKVHQAVIDAKESVSGFTVHEVTAELDAGPIIEQMECDVMKEDTVESLRTRIQSLEKEWYPKIVSEYLNNG